MDKRKKNSDIFIDKTIYRKVQLVQKNNPQYTKIVKFSGRNVIGWNYIKSITSHTVSI